MRKNLVLLATIGLLFVCSLYVFGEGTWEIIRGADWKTHFQDIYFADEMNGWAVGTKGVIVHTTDGGSTWTLQESKTDNKLKSVHFVDLQTGWVVGNKGTILHTSDGGTTWIQQESGTEISLNSVYFVNAKEGWVVGGDVILHTSDGGKKWEIQKPPDKFSYRGLHFVNPREGWIVGDRGSEQLSILHTRDGGITWKPQNSGTQDGLNDVYFVDIYKGWAVGENSAILHTDNGGDSWLRQNSPRESNLLAVHFVNESEGWVLGEKGVILHTNDGGSTWFPQNIDAPGYLTAIHFVSPQKGWVTHDYGLILHTENAGITWVPQTSSMGALNSVCFLNTREGWAVGGLSVEAGPTEFFIIIPYFVPYPGLVLGPWFGTHPNSEILHTIDGGIIWERVQQGFPYMDVRFSSDKDGWVAGLVNEVLYTPDGGATWISRGANPLSQQLIMKTRFIDRWNGWALVEDHTSGTKYSIFLSYDGGATWKTQYTFDDTLSDIYFLNDKEGWAVGEAGIILHTSDGGVTWRPQGGGMEGILLTAVHFVDSDNGWAVGGKLLSKEFFIESIILHTSDGGKTWIPQESGTEKMLGAVYFVNAEQGWVVGANGTILHTTDGGKTWTPQDSGTTANLYDISYDGEGNIWIVGDFGTVLRYTDFSLLKGKRAVSVVLSSPVEGTFVPTDSPTLKWSTSPNAESYWLQIAKDEEFSDVVVEEYIVSASHDVPAGILKRGQTYYWRVKAINSIGPSEWSTIQSFTVETVEIGYPRWDVNQDGIVDIFDLVLVGKHFGEDYRKLTPSPIAGQMRSAHAEGDLWLDVHPVFYPHQLLYVEIKTTPIQDLYGYQFDLAFDPIALELLSIAPSQMLKQGETQTYWNISKQRTAVNVMHARQATKHGVNAEGTLVKAVFRVKDTQYDGCFVYLTNVKLADSKAQWIPVNLRSVEMSLRQLFTPAQSMLFANYPNPFNPETRIPYQLAEDADIVIRIHNIKGQLVRLLNLGTKEAGIYINKAKAAYWDGRDNFGQPVSSGVYFYTIKAGNFTATRKMVLTK